MTPSQTRNDDASAELRFAKSRRRFLQGVGACLALPSMESLFSQRVEAAAARAAGGLAATASGVPKRMAFVYFPNGAIQPTWWPKGDPKDFDLNTTMKPLEPIKGKIQVLGGACRRACRPSPTKARYRPPSRRASCRRTAA